MTLLHKSDVDHGRLKRPAVCPYRCRGCRQLSQQRPLPVPRKVCIARGRLDLTVTEELSDHRQAFPECESPRGEAVSQVHAGGRLRARPPCERPSTTRSECARGAAHAAGNTQGLSAARQRGEDLYRRRRQRHRPRSSLRVTQAQLIVFEVDVLPSQRHDFVAPAAGQHQEAQRRGRARRERAPGFEVGEHPAQPVELLLRQKALAAARRIFLDEPAGVAPRREPRPISRPCRRAGRAGRPPGSPWSACCAAGSAAPQRGRA